MTGFLTALRDGHVAVIPVPDRYVELMGNARLRLELEPQQHGLDGT